MSFSKPLSAIWPGGVEELKEALVSKNFKVEVGTRKPEWTQLKNAVSVDGHRLESLAPAACYSYIKAKGPKFKGTVPAVGFLIVDLQYKGQIPETQPILWSSLPDAAMDFVLNKAYPQEWSGPSAAPPKGVTVESSVHLGPDCKIGEGTIIEAHVRIGARVQIGRNCRIGSGSRIADDTVLGDDCVLLGSDVIGGPGFGSLRYPESPVQQMRKHVGRVVIGNRVRIGSHVSVDRGVFDDTIIGDDCLFDNHVQVGHNCIIGRNSIFCSFVGLSGSTTVGDHSVFAGMVGTAGHVKIGSRVVVAAQSGISKDIEDDAQVKGYPPKPLAEALKIQTLVTKLPELFDRLKKLEKSEDS